MNTETTSLARANSAPEQWRHFASFLREPELPAATTRFSDGLRATLRMLVLDLAIMIVLLSIVLVAILAGFELPSNALDDLEMTIPVVLGIVIAAPVVEEIVFRSWLSGKPGQILAIVIGLAAIIALVAIGPSTSSPALVVAILAGSLVAAVVGLVALRKRAPLNVFTRFFPWFFWASALVFAVIHVFNYEEGHFAALLPLVMPQFALGIVCAYLRVHHGLWSAMLLHSLHNGAVVLFVLSGLQLVE
jgi:membrane protease YdiL (CAAX protease family)